MEEVQWPNGWCYGPLLWIIIAKRGQITEPMGRGGVEETSASTLFIFFTFIPNALEPENTFLKGP